jgi:hypothetical protein
VLGIRLIPAPPGSPPAAGPDVLPAEPVGGLASIGLAGDGYSDDGYADSELPDPDLPEQDLPDPGLTGPGRGAAGYPAGAGYQAVPPTPGARSGQPPASPSAAGDPGLPVILRCRDDGAISRWFGRLVRGQLMPLPAALLALAGVAMLAHLGLGDLPGILIIAPAIVMLVAAPGSSHSHGGPLDWLVPAVLQGAQYIYITALGMAAGIPVIVTFVLCTAIALRYADLGCASSPALPPRRPAQPPPARPASAGSAITGPASTVPERATWMGWEGRMLICGLGAAMGIGMFAYLALAAYVGALVGWKILTSSLVVREGGSR